MEIAAPGALYEVDFRRREEKIRSELLPPAAADRAWGVGLMESESNREDEKLSTEAGQLHDWECSAISADPSEARCGCHTQRTMDLVQPELCIKRIVGF